MSLNSKDAPSLDVCFSFTDSIKGSEERSFYSGSPFPCSYRNLRYRFGIKVMRSHQRRDEKRLEWSECHTFLTCCCKWKSFSHLNAWWYFWIPGKITKNITYDRCRPTNTKNYSSSPFSFSYGTSISLDANIVCIESSICLSNISQMI